MAKISFGKVPTVTVRRVLGIPARRPGKFQLCVKGQLSGKTYEKPPKGMGGRWNIEVWQAMYDAAKACGATVKKPRPGAKAKA
ncbi:MAG: hypothetical protein QW587_04725 [Candidatus Bathyarchaeia archaeon]